MPEPPDPSVADVPRFHGIIAYPVTPFSSDSDWGSAGTIDTTRLAVLVDRLVSAGVHAIAPLGSTGELAYRRAFGTAGRRVGEPRTAGGGPGDL